MKHVVPADALDQIKQLRAEVSDYCAFQMKISYLFEVDALQLDLVLKDEKDKSYVLSVVDKYRDLFGRVDVHLPFRDPSVPITASDYKRYQKLLQDHINEAVEHVSKNEQESIYVFSVLLNTDHSTVSVEWCTLNEFQTIKEKYHDRWPDKYRDDSDFSLLKYSPAEFQKNFIGECEDLDDLLICFADSISDTYEKYPYECHQIIQSAHSFVLLEHTVRALEFCASEVRKLQATSDFVFFVSPFDLPQELQILAAERTVSSEALKMIFPSQEPEIQNAQQGVDPNA